MKQPADKGAWVDTDWALTPGTGDAEVHEDSQITSGRTSRKSVDNPKGTPGFGVDEFCVDKNSSVQTVGQDPLSGLRKRHDKGEEYYI
ncbi:unnamed protein product [Arctogadus glacialis]